MTVFCYPPIFSRGSTLLPPSFSGGRRKTELEIATPGKSGGGSNSLPLTFSGGSKNFRTFRVGVLLPPDFSRGSTLLPPSFSGGKRKNGA